MPAKLISKDGKHTVIRPLAYCFEDEIENFARMKKYPIIPCTLCGSQPDLKRKKVKAWLKGMKKENPEISHSILKGLGNIRLDRLLDQRFLTPNFWGKLVKDHSLELEREWLSGAEGSGFYNL